MKPQSQSQYLLFKSQSIYPKGIHSIYKMRSNNVHTTFFIYIFYPRDEPENTPLQILYDFKWMLTFVDMLTIQLDFVNYTYLHNRMPVLNHPSFLCICGAGGSTLRVIHTYSHLMPDMRDQCRSVISRISGCLRGAGLQGVGYDVGSRFARGGLGFALV